MTCPRLNGPGPPRWRRHSERVTSRIPRLIPVQPNQDRARNSTGGIVEIESTRLLLTVHCDDSTNIRRVDWEICPRGTCPLAKPGPDDPDAASCESLAWLIGYEVLRSTNQ